MFLSIRADLGKTTRVPLNFLSSIATVSDWQAWNRHWELSTKIKKLLDVANYQFAIVHTNNLSELTKELAKRSHDRELGELWKQYAPSLLSQLRAGHGFEENERFWHFLLGGLLGRYPNLGYMLQQGLARARYRTSMGWHNDFFPPKHGNGSVGGLVITWHHPQVGFDKNGDALHELALSEPRIERDDSIE